MNIFLYGPSGSGKSAVGRQLAQALELPFADLDSEIIALAGISIPEIFASQGESSFRAQERAILFDLVDRMDGVIALGGGALVNSEVRQKAEAAGPVVCLSAPLDILLARLLADENQRPLLAGGTGSTDPAVFSARLADLLERRGPHYRSFSVQIDTSQITPEEAAWQVQIRLGRFRVNGMGQSYDVIIGSSSDTSLDGLGNLLQQRNLKGPLGLVSDENVAPLYAQRLTDSLNSAGYVVKEVRIQPGETYKTIETVSHLWDGFLEAGLERGSTIVALGGGVVGDLAGFAAATYMRGIRWVGVPTTLLAMCDSSLGGKTGADLPRGKNLVGAFHPPALVLADIATLETLPEIELRNGLAEVVKHGVISDPQLFELCSQGLTVLQTYWLELVRRAVAVKIKVIQDDPYEKGQRAALNFGHTIGHAVELVSGFEIKHGQAVAIGMVAETRLAEHLGIAGAGLAECIATTLRKLGLPTEIPPRLARERLIASLSLDKKRSAGKARFALPARIGEVITGVSVDETVLLSKL